MVPGGREGPQQGKSYLHMFIEILANMTQVSDVAPGSLVFFFVFFWEVLYFLYVLSGKKLPKGESTCTFRYVSISILFIYIHFCVCLLVFLCFILVTPPILCLCVCFLVFVFSFWCGGFYSEFKHAAKFYRYMLPSDHRTGNHKWYLTSMCTYIMWIFMHVQKCNWDIWKRVLFCNV